MSGKVCCREGPEVLQGKCSVQAAGLEEGGRLLPYYVLAAWLPCWAAHACVIYSCACLPGCVL